MRAEWHDLAPKWVADRIPGCERGFGECRGLIVRDRFGRCAAGVVFHDWNPERGLIELSCAADDPRWLTRGVARDVWGYAFAAARMAVARTSENNRPVRRIWAACGAAEHVIPELWGPGEAGVILTLTRPQWLASRLGGGNEQAISAEAA